jgi:hypothetical protein
VRPPVPRPNQNEAYRRGLADGENRAYNYVRAYHGTITTTVDGRQQRIPIRGPQLLRLLHRRYDVNVGGTFLDRINIDLRRRHHMPWPIMPSHY